MVQKLGIFTGKRYPVELSDKDIQECCVLVRDSYDYESRAGYPFSICIPCRSCEEAQKQLRLREER